MDNIAKLSKLDREYLFKETANAIDIPTLLVEKDFWVVWLLSVLSKDKIADSLYFRGGTSLSKAFGIIDRFSEDIDIAVAPKMIYPNIYDHLEVAPSRSQIGKIMKKLRQRARDFVENELLEKLTNGITHIIGEGDWQLKILITDRVANIIFHYPRSLAIINYSSSYIPTAVKLEPDARAAIDPSMEREISPFIASHFPGELTEKSCTLKTVNPERTFWEKVALLHRIFIKHGFVPERFSRHCYDVVQLAEYLDMFENPGKKDMLQSVIERNKKFYEQTENTYAGALDGGLLLFPDEEQFKALEVDYSKTGILIYQPTPKFSTLNSKLTRLQEIINNIP